MLEKHIIIAEQSDFFLKLTGQRATHVFDLFVVSNLFDEVCKFFVSLFLCGAHNALRLFFIVAELKAEWKK
jgi:hypothetical protein